MEIRTDLILDTVKSSSFHQHFSQVLSGVTLDESSSRVCREYRDYNEV